MFASTVNLLLANSGSRGVDLVRALSRFTRTSNLMSRFIESRRDVARKWIKARPHDVASLTLLSETDLDAIYGTEVVKTLSKQLGIEPNEVVRLLNGTLYTGARLVAPDGEDVSDRAAKRLDEDLKSAIL